VVVLGSDERRRRPYLRPEAATGRSEESVFFLREEEGDGTGRLFGPDEEELSLREVKPFGDYLLSTLCCSG
jgi:hypothetical protein